MLQLGTFVRNRTQHKHNTNNTKNTTQHTTSCPLLRLRWLLLCSAAVASVSFGACCLLFVFCCSLMVVLLVAVVVVSWRCLVVVVVCSCPFVSEVRFLDLSGNELPRKHLPKMFSLIKNEGRGLKDFTVPSSSQPQTMPSGRWASSVSAFYEKKSPDIASDDRLKALYWFCGRLVHANS